MQNLKCFETLKSFITFDKPAPLLIVFLPSPELRILGLLAAEKAASLGSKCTLTAAATFALVTVSTAGMRQVTATQRVSEACLPDFQACPLSL